MEGTHTVRVRQNGDEVKGTVMNSRWWWVKLSNYSMMLWWWTWIRMSLHLSEDAG